MLDAVLQGEIVRAQQGPLRAAAVSAEAAQLQAAVFSCFAELAKKGMDPVDKVQLLHSFRLSQQLAFWCEWYLTATGQGGQDEAEEALLPLEKLGQLTELLVVELLGCWCTLEDALLALSEGQGDPGQTALASASFPALQAAAAPTASMLRLSVPIAVQLLGDSCLLSIPCIGGVLTADVYGSHLRSCEHSDIRLCDGCVQQAHQRPASAAEARGAHSLLPAAPSVRVSQHLCGRAPQRGLCGALLPGR